MPTPYAGNPANYPASVDLPAGSDTPSSATFHTAYEGTLDRTAYLLQNARVGAVSNWHEPRYNVNPAFTWGAGVSSVAYDPFLQRWLLSVTPAASPQNFYLYGSYDGGRNWKLVNLDTAFTGRFGVAMAVRPVDGVTAILRSDGTTDTMSLLTPGVSFVNTAQPFLNGVDLAVMAYAFGTFVVVGFTGFGTSTITGHMATSSAGTGLWVDLSSSLPAGWVGTNTNNVVQLIAAQDPIGGLLVAMCGLTPGADHSRLLVPLGSTDITPAFLGGTALQIRGLAWSQVDQLWGILAVDAGSAYLYTSPDAATWTLVHTFTGYTACGLATVGSVWACVVCHTGLGFNRVLYSNNVSQGASCTFASGDYSDQSPLTGFAIPGLAVLQSSSFADGSGWHDGNQFLFAQINFAGGAPGPNLVAVSEKGAVAQGGGF